MTKAEAEKMTWRDIKRIEELLKKVEYEYRNSPYDRIPWAVQTNAVYKETLRRFKEKKRKKI